MSHPILSVESISKVFPGGLDGQPVVAIEKLTFDVHEGESLVLLGPSGCGKTTFLRIAAGLDFPTSGWVLLDGKRIEGPSRERGMVFQHYSSFPWLTVLENVKFGLKYRPDIKPEGWDEIGRYFVKLVGLQGTSMPVAVTESMCPHDLAMRRGHPSYIQKVCK